MVHIPTRDGQLLHVRVLGRGRPCLLVHGFASDSRAWLPFVAPLLHRHRFVLPDLRGFGRSQLVPIAGSCPLTQFAEDLEDVLAALRVEQAPVVGISMGAFSALQCFRLHGGRRFTRYMHIDQGPFIRNRQGAPHGLLGRAQAPFFTRLEALLAALDNELMARPYEALPQPLRMEFWRLMAEFSAAAFAGERLRPWLLGMAQSERVMRTLFPVARWQVYVQIVRAYLELDYDLRDAIRAIEVPLTVLIGGRSRMYPAEGQRTIAKLAPHARVREIAHAGHMLPYEAPGQFMRELRQFLDGT